MEFVDKPISYLGPSLVDTENLSIVTFVETSITSESRRFGIFTWKIFYFCLLIGIFRIPNIPNISSVPKQCIYSNDVECAVRYFLGEYIL